MLGIDDAIANATKLIDDGINKIWPDPTAKATAEAMMIKATSDAAIASMAQQLSIILSDSQSADKWTSRARPSFMYVMYVLMLWAIPMGLVYAVRPDVSANIITGMKAFWAAIPDPMWNFFMVGFTGYAVSRAYEKAKGVS